MASELVAAGAEAAHRLGWSRGSTSNVTSAIYESCASDGNYGNGER